MTKMTRMFSMSKSSKNNTPIENTYDEWYDAEGNFKWDEYAATCPSVLRKQNPHIKTKNGDRVY